MYEVLKGLKIVEGASFVAAPLCGLTFVQLGADVIRFDPVGGGPDFGRWPVANNGLSLYWEGLNKGKRSIAIDLARPEGREIAIELITAPSRSGCFVTNYPSGGFLAHDRLSTRRQDLISVRIMGSTDGRTALDYTVNCAAGYPQMTGSEAGSEPVNHVLPAWDIGAGLTAAVSMLAAMHDRSHTGRGREIQVPLSNVAFSTLSSLGNIAEVSAFGRDRPRYGNALYGSFGRDFATADGRRLMIVAITQRQWLGLLAALELQSDVAAIEERYKVDFTLDEGARFVHREDLFGVVERAVVRRRFSELPGLFDKLGVCWGEYQTVQEALQNDPRLSSANPMFERLSHPSGETYLAAGFPGIFSGLDRSPVRAAPRLGAHTDDILATELGLSSGEIGRLHDGGIVAGPERTTERR
jgi:2-methylfumaryl-CoA isomerase